MASFSLQYSSSGQFSSVAALTLLFAPAHFQGRSSVQLKLCLSQEPSNFMIMLLKMMMKVYDNER